MTTNVQPHKPTSPYRWHPYPHQIVRMMIELDFVDEVCDVLYHTEEDGHARQHYIHVLDKDEDIVIIGGDEGERIQTAIQLDCDLKRENNIITFDSLRPGWQDNCGCGDCPVCCVRYVPKGWNKIEG